MQKKFFIALAALCLHGSLYAGSLNSRGFEKEAFSLQNDDSNFETSFLLQGEFYYRPSGDFVLTAPHGDFDLGTYEIVRDLCLKHKEWTCILATHFRDNSGSDPFNVNRPTLLTADDCNTPDPLATRVFDAWMDKVKRVPPRIYVEIHGNVRAESVGRIEVAYKGYQASELKTSLDASIFAVDDVDDVWFKATQNKKCGAIQQMNRALHFELPASLRDSPQGQSQASTILEAALLRLNQQ